MIKNALIAFAVSIVAGIGFGLVDGLTHSDSSTTTYTIPVVLGVLTFFILQMRSGNRKEVRVDDASRKVSLSAVPPSGQALLYVYREGFVGKAVGWNVSLDGAALAQLRSPRFTQTILSPGSHTLGVSLGGFAASQNKPAEMAFEARPDEVIVFAMKAKMGALSNTLSFVPEPDARAALQRFSKMQMVAPERATQSN